MNSSSVLDRSARPESREIIVESDLELELRQLNVSSEAGEVRDADADHRGARLCHLPDGGFDDGVHFLMDRIGTKEIHEHADASTFQAVSIEECGVGAGNPARRKR